MEKMYSSPHRTKTLCKKPEFADKYLHRIEMVPIKHLGSKGYIDENGMPGWIRIFVCTGCGKQYKINGMKKCFVPDIKPNPDATKS